MRRASRTDGNHAAIVAALRCVGCLVADCSRVGHGFPDVLILHRGTCQLVLIEIKTLKGKRTPDQVRFEARGWPVQIVRSVEEALAVVGIQ